MKRKINPHIKQIKKARKLERWAKSLGVSLDDGQGQTIYFSRVTWAPVHLIVNLTTSEVRS